MLEQLPTLFAASHWALVSRTLALHVGVAPPVQRKQHRGAH